MKTTLDIPPGIVGDDTTHAASGRWADGSNMRFRLGRAQTIGGWESLIAETLGGVCRTALPWTDNAAILNIAFGTHASLEIYQGGELFDVTPSLAAPSVVLTNPLSVTNGSSTVTVAHKGHGLLTGEAIAVTNAGTVGRLNPNGAFAITKIDDDQYSYTAGGAANLAKTLASNPLSVTNGSPTVTVAEPAHGITTGTIVTITGAAAVGGVTPNGSFPVTVMDANSYSYAFTTNANSTATGGGASVVATVPATGGVEVAVAPQRSFSPGPVDGTGSAGYGTGGYGVGGYGQPSATDYFPRTWSLAAWGENLLANPRGGAIHQWANDRGVVAAPLSKSPANVTYMLVAPQDQVFALGCNEEVSGVFNHLCIRHSSVRNNTEWETAADTTAREYILPGGGRIVAGRVMGPHIAVWTTQGLFVGQFIGSLAQPWRFDRVGDKCGLIGPNAVVVVGQTAYWVSPDRQFHAYGLGGAVQTLPCPIRTAFAENLAASQSDKIVASSNAEFSEVRFDYPDGRDGFENSRYLAFSLAGEGWHRGVMARTAMVDAGPSSYPCGVSPEGRIYWHERGQSADGGPMQYFIETADQMFSESQAMMVREVRPDFQDQLGPVQLTLRGRFEPQGDETVSGPVAMTPGARKVDLRTTGRFFKVRLEGNALPAACRVGQLVFDVAPAGER